MNISILDQKIDDANGLKTCIKHPLNSYATYLFHI